METASSSNEHILLLGDEAETDIFGGIFCIDFSPNEQTSLEGNDAIYNEQASPFGQDSASNCDTKAITTSSPRTSEPETYKVSLEEIVQAMCSAWQKSRQPDDHLLLDCKHSEGSQKWEDFFSMKQIYEMRLAWKRVTKGRRLTYRPNTIAEAVATAIAKELITVPPCDGNDIDINFHARKNLITACYLYAWHTFDSEDREVRFYRIADRYFSTFEESDENRPVASNFWLQLVKTYDWIHDFIFNIRLQLFLHTLLFIWPLSFLIIGTKYMECPMGHHLSPLMMVLGCLGCFIILYRLGLMYFTQNNYYYYFWSWKYLLLAKLTFLVIFVVQAFHFLCIDPTTEPDPYQCVQDFYNAALVLNYVSIPLASVYVFVYSVITFKYQLNYWHLAFRYL